MGNVDACVLHSARKLCAVNVWEFSTPSQSCLAVLVLPKKKKFIWPYLNGNAPGKIHAFELSV